MHCTLLSWPCTMSPEDQGNWGAPYPAFFLNVGLLRTRLLSSSLSLCYFLLWKETIYQCFHSYIWIKSFMSLFLRLCPKRKEVYNRRAFIYLSTPLSLVVKAPAAVKPGPHESGLSFWDKHYQIHIYGLVSRDVRPVAQGADLFLQSHFKTL